MQNSDRIRMLAVTGQERNRLPQVPTTVEQGFRTVIADIWFGIVGPAGDAGANRGAGGGRDQRISQRGERQAHPFLGRPRAVVARAG